MLRTLILAAFLAGVVCDVREKARLSKGFVSSDFDGLQAPLVSDRRQGIAVRHDPSADLCKDPFHSFLCTAGKKRVVFDGRLRPGAVLPPGKRLGEAQPIESGSALLPTSLEYLPSEAGKPSRYYLPEPSTSTSRPPALDSVETFETKNFPEIVNVPDNAYLPVGNEPQSTIENSVTAVKKPSRAYLPLEEPNVSAESTNLSPNIEGSALLPASIQSNPSKNEESHTLERLCNDPFHSFLCKPLKPRKRIDGKLRPEAKIPPNALLGASSIRREARVLPFESGSSVLSGNQPSSNNLPAIGNKPLINNNHKSSFAQVITQTNGADNPGPTSNQGGFRQSFNAPPQGTYYYNRAANSLSYAPAGSELPNTNDQGGDSSPSNVYQTLINRSNVGYTYNKPAVPFPNPASTSQTFVAEYQQPSNSFPSPSSLGKPTVHNEYIPSKLDFQNPAQNVYYPTSGQNPGYPRPTVVQQPAISESQTTTYSPPLFQSSSLASQARPVVYTSTNKPFNIQTPAKPTYQYPTSSNTQQTFVPGGQNGYNYQKPAFPFNYGTSVTPSISYQSSFQTSTNRPYAYQTTSRPVSVQTTQRPVTYQTSTYRPIEFQTTQRPVPDYQYPKPSNVQQNFVRPTGQNGYNYQKPALPFNYGTSTEPSSSFRPSFQSTANKPFSYQTTSRPATIQTTQRPFTYQTSSNRPVFQATEPPVSDYQYPKPSNVNQNFVRPDEQNGYNYHKPAIPFNYGTSTSFRPSFQTTTYRPFSYQTTSRPATIQTTQRPFTYQTSTSRPVQDYQYPRPSNVEQSFVRPEGQNGYNYQKPAKPFTYGTTAKPSSSSYPSLQMTTYRPFTYQTTSRPATFPSTQRPITYQTSTSRPVFQTSLRPIPDYQYPKPSNVNSNFVRPDGQNGYNYQKPSVPFTYGTTLQPSTSLRPSFSTTSFRPITYPTTSRPSIFQTTQKPNTYQTSTARPAIQSTQRPTPDNPYPKPSNIEQNYIRPSGQNGYNYQKPALPFTYGTTAKPSTSFNPFLQTTTHRPFTYQTTSRPATSLSTQKPITYQTSTSRPVFQTSSRPIPDYQYPKPSNVNQNFVRPDGQNGYNYQKPSVPFTYGTTLKPSTSFRPSFQTTTYRPSSYQTTSRPATIQTTQRPFTYQTSTSRPVLQTTQRPVQDYQYPRPSNVQQSFVRPEGQNGYNYQKPAKPFTYGTTVKPSSTFRPAFQTTTLRPITYPTTSIPSTFQTTQRPTTFQTISNRPIFQTIQRPVTDYQYPKPSNVQQNIVRPDVQNGYNYQKPARPFTYGTTVLPSTIYKPTSQPTSLRPITYQTTQRPITYQTSTNRPVIQTTQRPIPDYQYPRPSNVEQNFARPDGQDGYNYQKPSKPFSYPSTSKPKPSSENVNYQRPSTVYNYPTTVNPPFEAGPSNPFPKPSNEQESVVPLPAQNGYNYERPNKPFSLPFGSQKQYSPANSLRSQTIIESALNQRAPAFGERLRPRLPAAGHSVSSNSLSTNDEFLPLRNYEII